jgi:glutamine cyclotransferase
VKRIVSTLVLFVLLLGSWLGSQLLAERSVQPAAATVPTLSATVVGRYPHDPRAYTQGLTIADGSLYEGTGWFGESSLRRVDLESGSVLQQISLPADVFGEGIAVVADRILQLTWRSQLGYVYDRPSFGLLQTFGYSTEGWGLTYDGSRLIMSDGSATLRFLDPATQAELGWLEVRAAGRPVRQLNELEYIGGLLYANVYQSDQVAVIDPGSGEVRSWIDLSSLNPTQHGIAYDAQQGRLFVTGKRWPTLYEIQVDQPGS